MTVPTVATKSFRLWQWMRHRTDAHAAMYEPAEGAPHKRVESLPWGDPVNQFGVVWLDEARAVPQRVIDGDGCTAAIIGPAPEEP